MSGFFRQIQPVALDRAGIRTVIADFVYEQEIAELLRSSDPFGIDNDCESPFGHEPVASCGRVVCPHCARIFA